MHSKIFMVIIRNILRMNCKMSYTSIVMVALFSFILLESSFGMKLGMKLNVMKPTLIKAPPSKLTNVTVHPSTVVATVRWHLISDGGYPVTHFTLLYYPLVPSSNKTRQLPLPVHISPAARQFFIYHLYPATQYVFRIWATNRLGPGEASTVQATTVRPISPHEIVEYLTKSESQYSTSSVWMIGILLVVGFVLLLPVLSCILICKNEHNIIPDDINDMSRITSNSRFEYNLEETYLLEEADFNANIEKVRTTNNNTVVQPSS
ncbi:fasciclin-2-like isoform X2 [Limulus polyphemus]|uniref:Fasciclin-2-like isoform X2 n=1 Tax=Limulus polyphemus TaxID=6850 RepID=A0ABM1T6J3_LIMPO|nr:fasciclin-2-like isoform X2 [Limulus polyphemus]